MKDDFNLLTFITLEEKLQTYRDDNSDLRTCFTEQNKRISELEAENKELEIANEALANNNHILKLGFDEVKAKNERLKELADGAKTAVELYVPDSPAGKQWQKYWLDTFYELIEPITLPESDNNEPKP